MAFADLLQHSATTWRRSGALDEFGQPADVNANSVQWLDSEPCRMSRTSGGERFTERSLDVIVEMTEIFFSADVDVRESDQVEVRDAGQNVMLARTSVTLVRVVTDGGGQPHHLEVLCQQIRGS
jgi:hypothetical protein